MPALYANGITINYAVEGDGPETVLLINGLADDLETWGYQMPALLEAGYRVVRFDNRGIGASDRPAGPYSTELLADDAKAVADELGLDDYHVMGVSMGGMIAQRFALKYPSGIRSLTLACTYAAPGPFCSRMFAMWADAAQVLGVPFVMRDVTLWAFTLDFFRTREAELIEFETGMRYLDQPVHAYLAQLAVIQNHDETAELGTLTMPTLVLAGEEDILIPTALSHDLHELIPGSQWRTTTGGHGCMWEHPDEFNSAFVGFLRENERIH
ncbi:MAG: Non-heme bromoperoxidase BpoC [Microbacteriaceae bacterium]|nr:Non-heme bromoperoxidase BpoC [Microbacteriaceae bacterium]